MLKISKKGISRKALVIDRVSATVPISDKNEQSEIDSRIKFIGRHWDGAYAGYVKPAGYKLAYRLHVANDQSSTMTVHAKPVDPYNSYLRVEYNPAKANQVRLRSYLEHILPGGWKRYVSEAFCTRIDLAIDVVGVQVSELLVYWPGMRHSRQYFASGKMYEDCLVLTREVGKYGGERFLTVYDRVRHLPKANMYFDKKESESECDITRFEVRVRPYTKWNGVEAMGNVFSELEVTSLSAFVGQKDQEFGTFLMLCKAYGAQYALQRLDGKKRALYRSRIANAYTPWWSPAGIWKGFAPALVQHLGPSK